MEKAPPYERATKADSPTIKKDGERCLAKWRCNMALLPSKMKKYNVRRTTYVIRRYLRDFPPYLSIQGLILAAEFRSFADLDEWTPSLVYAIFDLAFEVKEILPYRRDKARTARLWVLSRHAPGSAVDSVSFRLQTKSLRKTCFWSTRVAIVRLKPWHSKQ